MLENILKILLEMLEPSQILNLFYKEPISDSSNLELLDRVKITDWTILKTLIPQSFYHGIDTNDSLIQFVLTFSLRNRVALLALILHKLSCQTAEIPLPVDSKIHFDEMRSLLEERSLIKNPPIVGFNASGIFFEHWTTGTCRYVDSYTPKQCGEPSKQLFCDKHQNEIWWSGNEQKSVLTTMMQFYWDFENLHSYNRSELDHLLSNFWAKFSVKDQFISQQDLESSLRYFGLKSVQELEILGLAAIRKLFLKESLKTHPDHGGDAVLFLQMKESYQCLKLYLEKAS